MVTPLPEMETEYSRLALAVQLQQDYINGLTAMLSGMCKLARSNDIALPEDVAAWYGEALVISHG